MSTSTALASQAATKPRDWTRGYALAAGIAYLVTFAASIPSMAQELLAMADHQSVQVDLRSVFVPEAMQDLADGHAEVHHRKVAAAAAGLSGCDTVMLAQFSMADAQPQAQAALSCPVLSSPDCAVHALQQALSHAR